MSEMVYQESRISSLNSKEIKNGDYILYWMQAAQRSEWNHALEYAISLSNRYEQPIVACFGLTPSFLEANYRHYAFMLEGLRETQLSLNKRGISLLIIKGSPPRVINSYNNHGKSWTLCR